MKKRYSIILLLAIALSLCACGKKETPAAEEQEKAPRISSIQYYNKTGKMQREDIYEYDSTGNAEVTQQIVYTYNDRGYLTNIKKEAGGPGYDKDIESYFYMGENCTQKILFNENGSSSEVYYWKYYDDGAVKAETHTTMLSASSKVDEVKEYDEDGVLVKSSVTSPDGYTYTDFIYDEESFILKEEDTYFSATGKKADYEPQSVLKYYYDDGGYLFKTVRTDPAGAVLECTVFEYDEVFNIVSEKTYSSGELNETTLLTSKTREYDALGELIFESDTDSDGAGNSTEYRYDDQRNVIKKIEREIGETDSELVTQTTYDIHNNPMKQTVSLNGGPAVTEFECTYEYYDSGSIKTCTYYEVNYE